MQEKLSNQGLKKNDTEIMWALPEQIILDLLIDDSHFPVMIFLVPTHFLTAFEIFIKVLFIDGKERFNNQIIRLFFILCDFF